MSLLSPLLEEGGKAAQIIIDVISGCRCCKHPFEVALSHLDVIVLKQLPVTKQAEHTMHVSPSGQSLQRSAMNIQLAQVPYLDGRGQ